MTHGHARVTPSKLYLGVTLSSALAVFAAESNEAWALEDGYRLEIEAGGIWQSRNDAQSPARATSTLAQGSRFSIADLQGAGPSPFVRVSGSYGWGGRHQVHLLYAPLTITGSGRFAAPVLFQGAAFAPNALTRASYRFDSYRIGYRYKVLDYSEWQLWGGVTLKVRDAEIALAQNAVSASRANIGPVPLLSLYAQRELGPRWRAIVDIEGLAAPQGRAVDAAIKIRYQLSDRIGVSAGYRTLEGGADNKKVYTFAWLHYGLVSFDFQF